MLQRILTVLACGLGFAALVCLSPQQIQAEAGSAMAPMRSTWQPPAGVKQMPIWPEKVPDMEGVPKPAETMEVQPKSIAGLPTTMLHNVTVPTMMVFPPKGRNTGASLIVFPGGGFRVLAIDLEGTEVCDWATSKGMTCVLLKYRVPKSADYHDDDCNCRVTPKIGRALQDAQRTIKIVRSRASELGINPHKIGVIGFSAGGFMVAQTSNIFEPAYRPIDAIDRVSSRPDFAIAAYPGHLCREGGTFNSTIHVTKDTTPTFIVQDWDDNTDDICNSTMYARALEQAGVPAEVHLFAKGDHAFALRHIPIQSHACSHPCGHRTWIRRKVACPFSSSERPMNGRNIRAPSMDQAWTCHERLYFRYQVIRGRGQSQGRFAMMRPPAENPTGARKPDEITDTCWDTIEWLLKNVPGGQWPGRRLKRSVRDTKSAVRSGKGGTMRQGLVDAGRLRLYRIQNGFHSVFWLGRSE